MGFKSWIKGAWNKVKGFGSKVWNGAKNVATKVWNGVIKPISKIASPVAKAVAAAVPDPQVQAVASGVSAVSDVINTLSNQVPNKEAQNRIQDQATKIINDGRSIVGDITKGANQLRKGDVAGAIRTGEDVYNRSKNIASNGKSIAKATVM